MSATRPRTLFDKIWDSHVVERLPDGTCVLYIDRHLVHEVTSPQAFEGLRMAGRKVRRPDCTIAVADHNIPTVGSRIPADIKETDSRIQVETLEKNVKEFGVPYIPILDVRQGIVHIIGPELGISLPGTTLVCGDSHTSTHGALGALAFGIGTSEVEHVLATQTLLQNPAKNMRIDVSGTLGLGCSAKDIVLAIIGKITTAGGTGHVIEYTGDTICALDMAGKPTMRPSHRLPSHSGVSVLLKRWRAISNDPLSSTCSGRTMTRSSRPACTAKAFSTPSKLNAICSRFSRRLM